MLKKYYDNLIKTAEIKSIAKALSIIDFLSQYSQVSLGEIAEEMGMPKSTVSGILTTLLKQFNYVKQTNNGDYELDIYLFEM